MASHSGGGTGGTGEFATAFMLVLFGGLILLWVGTPYLKHAYYMGAYYQYRGLEYVTPDSWEESIGIKSSRRTIARSLNKGVNKYDPDELSKHLLVPKLFYGSLAFIGFCFLSRRIWRDKPDNYLEKLKMEDMELHILKKYWQNAPVIGRHLDRRHPLKDKLWRFSRKPWEFAYEFGVITDKKGQLIPLKYEQQEINLVKPTRAELENQLFKVKRSDELFTKQLGHRIDINTVEDVLRLPREHKALIVPLLSDIDGFYNDRVGHSDKWLKQYALSFLDVKLVLKSIFNRKYIDQLPPFKSSVLNMDGVDDAIRIAFEIDSAKQHLLGSAYSNVLIVQLMTKTIVMKSSYFKWLKPMNRSLWYGLNNVGKPGTAHIEGAGPLAHAEHEIKAERKEYVPQIKRATRGLRSKLKEYYFLNS